MRFVVLLVLCLGICTAQAVFDVESRRQAAVYGAYIMPNEVASMRMDRVYMDSASTWRDMGPFFKQSWWW